MSVKRYIPLAAGFMLAACASGGASSPRWSAAAWNGIAPQTIGTENYSFFAAPLDGQGFKLKLTLSTDDLFRMQEAGENTLPEELRAAAEQAAPEGCRLDTLVVAPDGSAEAAYDCQT